jgi:hypothetical protein
LRLTRYMPSGQQGQCTLLIGRKPFWSTRHIPLLTGGFPSGWRGCALH